MLDSMPQNSRRRGNDEQAESSTRTRMRATILVNALWHRAGGLPESCHALRRAVAAELGEEVVVFYANNDEERVDEWRAFLTRWSYDREQKLEVRGALSSCGDTPDAGCESAAPGPAA